MVAHPPPAGQGLELAVAYLEGAVRELKAEVRDLSHRLRDGILMKLDPDALWCRLHEGGGAEVPWRHEAPTRAEFRQLQAEMRDCWAALQRSGGGGTCTDTSLPAAAATADVAAGAPGGPAASEVAVPAAAQASPEEATRLLSDALDSWVAEAEIEPIRKAFCAAAARTSDLISSYRSCTGRAPPAVDFDDLCSAGGQELPWAASGPRGSGSSSSLAAAAASVRQGSLPVAPAVHSARLACSAKWGIQSAVYHDVRDSTLAWHVKSSCQIKDASDDHYMFIFGIPRSSYGHVVIISSVGHIGGGGIPCSIHKAVRGDGIALEMYVSEDGCLAFEFMPHPSWGGGWFLLPELYAAGSTTFDGPGLRVISAKFGKERY